MIEVATKSGKQMEESGEKIEEVKESEPIPPKKEVVEEELKQKPYVAPHPYKSAFNFC